MKKRTILLAEGVLLGVALVLYLALIARELRAAARTLRLISVGLRAIEKQTEVIGPAVAELNENLDRAAASAESADQPGSRRRR